MSSLTGSWIYRSFINDPDPVTTGDQALALIFGEGELEVEEATPGGPFRATLSFDAASVMDLTGTVSAGSGPLTVRANGRGRAGGPIADYDYDYLFYTVPDWPGGVNQRPALVGSVLRAADHGQAKKGMTASTITVRRES
jgi:hypothetical protein